MRAAVLVIVSSILVVVGLFSYRAQSFDGFVGSNGPLSTVQSRK
jgi:hypothetical protein